MSYDYSTVVAFALLEISADCLRGYAAPNGPSPALVKLTSDDAPIAFARASGHSTAAAEAGLRLGWCAFQIHGLRQAFAIGDDVKLRCGVSDEVLATLSIDMLSPAKPTTAQLSALDLIALVRAPDICPSLEQFIPFAINHYRRHGARQFIEACYQTLLGRWPEADAPDVDFALETEEDRVKCYVAAILASNEYQARWGEVIPGPFMSGFRFDTTGLI